MPRSPLKKGTGVLLYQQLFTILAERLKDHDPSQRLPSEAELMLEFKVSRNTVRAAIAKLIAAGLVEAVRGLGVYIVRQAGRKYA
jgi:DNA-binding GntR family transcriptional regulator